MKITGSKRASISAIVGGVIAASGWFAQTANAGATVADLKSLYGSELEVLGDVQRVDLAKGILTVAGQHIAISRATRFTFDGVAVDASAALHTISVGDLLAVSGRLGEPASSVDRATEAYLPGATTMFVKGKVDAVVPSLGVARIDELRLDLTPAMSDIRFEGVESGQVVEAVGTRPTANGL